MSLTYDAFDRVVEQNKSGTYYQVVYTPMGSKLGVFKAQVMQQLYVPLPGGTQAEYYSWGLSDYRHPDWLGSDRMEASPSHSILDNNAYAPFGEPYAQSGNGEISFTGQNKDTVWLQYDFLARQYDPKQGRWVSPDPAGVAAVDPPNPQTWNRYAYVMNSPLSYLDPLGLDTQCTTDSSGYTTCTSTVMGCPSGMTFQSGGCVGGQCQGAQGTINVNGITICGPSAEYIYIQNQIQQAEQCANGGCQGGYSGGGGSGGAANSGPQPPRQPPTIPQRVTKFVCKSSPAQRVFASVKQGAVVGAIRGGVSGFIGGEIAEPVGGGIPGAVLGGFLGGTIGAAGGVFIGSVIAIGCSLSGAY